MGKQDRMYNMAALLFVGILFGNKKISEITFNLWMLITERKWNYVHIATFEKRKKERSQDKKHLPTKIAIDLINKLNASKESWKQNIRSTKSIIFD